MKKIAGLLFLFAFCLMAADFWQKPYTDWSEKDLQKMITNSPWAHSTTIGGGVGISTADSGASAPISEGGGGGRGGRGGGGGGGGASENTAPGSGGPATDLVARWQSAMPIRQAIVRLKFGAEAGKSDDAKQYLEKQQTTYEIVLSGALQPFLHGNPEEAVKALSEVTFLSAKDKGAIKPTSIEVSKPGRSMDMLIAFPRSMPYTLDDKEVEFQTKLGTSTVKIKFRLKDMVYSGKLEM